MRRVRAGVSAVLHVQCLEVLPATLARFVVFGLTAVVAVGRGSSSGRLWLSVLLPTCSCLLKARYGCRTGISTAIGYHHDPILSPREFTVAKALTANPQLGSQHAQIGKWHLDDPSNYVREVDRSVPVVQLIDPTPPPPSVF